VRLRFYSRSGLALPIEWPGEMPPYELNRDKILIGPDSALTLRARPWLELSLKDLRHDLSRAGYPVDVWHPEPAAFYAAGEELVIFLVGCAVGQIAGGFFGKLGEVAYDYIAKAFGKLRKKIIDEGDHLDLVFKIRDGETMIKIEIWGFHLIPENEFDRVLYSLGKYLFPFLRQKAKKVSADKRLNYYVSYHANSKNWVGSLEEQGAFRMALDGKISIEPWKS